MSDARAPGDQLEEACEWVIERGIAITGCGGACFVRNDWNDELPIECDPLGALVIWRELDREDAIESACKSLGCGRPWLVRFLYGFHQERTVMMPQSGRDQTITGWKPDRPSGLGHALALKLKQKL